MSAQIIFITAETDQNICPSCSASDPATIGYCHPDGDLEFSGEINLFQQKFRATGFSLDENDITGEVKICRDADCRTLTVVVEENEFLDSDQLIQLNLK